LTRTCSQRRVLTLFDMSAAAGAGRGKRPMEAHDASRTQTTEGPPAAKTPRVVSLAHSAGGGAGPAAAPRDVVASLVEGLLPDFGAASVIESKLVNRVVMLDNPTSAAGPGGNSTGGGGGGGGGGSSGAAAATATAASGSAPWSKGPRLSRSQMRKRGLPRTVHADGCCFQDFVPLHRLWQQCVLSGKHSLPRSLAARSATPLRNTLCRS
jgi:hypothetical protein